MIKKEDSLLIKRILKNNKLTQQELALKLDVSKQFISLIVNSKKPLSSKLKSKIKKLYPNYIKEVKKLSLPDKIDIDFIEKFRLHHNYSSRKLSELLGISVTYYSLMVKGERSITDNIRKGIEYLNNHPNSSYQLPKKKTNNSIKLKYQDEILSFDNLNVYTSENHVSFDKTLLGNRNYHSCIVTRLKIDSDHVWLNSFDKAIIDFSSKELKPNKKYLVKYNNTLCLLLYNENKKECIALNTKCNTLNFKTPKLEEVYGEIIALLQ